MIEQIRFIIAHLPALLVGLPGQRPGGLLLSILLAIIGIGFGFLIGILAGSGYHAKWRLVRWCSRAYVELFRGLPLLLLMLLIYQLGGMIWQWHFTARMAAIIALTLYSSAYQAEIIRAGLQSVPPHLTESARILGSSAWHGWRTIQLRYAIRVMLPALVGQAISLFKDTSVVLVIGVTDLMMVTRIVLGSKVTNAPYWVALYLVAGMLYFVVAFTLSRVARRWEKQMQTGDLVHSFANY